MDNDPEQPPATANKLRAAGQAQQQGNFQRAQELYQDILQECPEHLDARVSLGLLYQAVGEIEQGRRCFAETRRLAPPDADLHVQLGALCHDRGETELAIDFFRQALALAPKHHRAWYNLGTTHLQREEATAAVEAYQEARRLAPEDVDTLYNLALALTRLEKFPAAAHAYHRALAVAPNDREVLYNLGVLYRRMSRYTEALRCFVRVIELDPDYAPAHSHLGAMWLELGEKELAAGFFEKLVALDHQAAAARHMLAALRDETPATASHDYVAGLFDHYAGRFESELMEQLGYRVPFLLAEMLRELNGDQMYNHLLDLGCGTGLAGEAFLARAARLTGVDISGGMLAQARPKGIYDELHQQDILTFCQSRPPGAAPHDLAVAADVLNYLGELEPFFTHLGNCLQPGGLLLFSIEEEDQTGDEQISFVLRENGRFVHSPPYIHRLIDVYGFKSISEQRHELRREKAAWVQGRLFLLQRRG